MNFVDKNRPDIKTVVIDTITYAMIAEFMEKAKTVGYAKFTEMGDNVYKTLKMIDKLRDDLTVIVMAHTEVKTFNGVDRTVFGVPGGILFIFAVIGQMYSIIVYFLTGNGYLFNVSSVQAESLPSNNFLIFFTSPDFISSDLLPKLFLM